MNSVAFQCEFCKQSLEAGVDMAGTEIACPSCKKMLTIPGHLPAHTDTVAVQPPRPSQTPRMITGITGAVMTCVAVFAPVLILRVQGKEVPIHIYDASILAVITIGIALAALLYAWRWKFRGLWAPGVVLLVLSLACIMLPESEGFREHAIKGVIEGTALTADDVGIVCSWGGPLLLVGSLFILAAAFTPNWTRK